MCADERREIAIGDFSRNAKLVPGDTRELPGIIRLHDHTAAAAAAALWGAMTQASTQPSPAGVGILIHTARVSVTSPGEAARIHHRHI